MTSVETILSNRPPSPANIPPEYAANLGSACMGMYQRLVSTPEGRAKLDAWKAAHPHKRKEKSA